MVVELGGWDHLWLAGEGCRVVLERRVHDRQAKGKVKQPLRGRNGHERMFMVALGFVGEAL